MPNKHVKRVCYSCISYQIREEKPYCGYFFMDMVKQSPNRFCKAFKKKSKELEKKCNKRLAKFVERFCNG